MTYIEFLLLLGLHDTDYTNSLQYEKLLIDFPLGVTAKTLW